MAPAKGRQGRKALYNDAPMFVYPIRLPVMLARAARKLGEGNLSAGVRRALEQLK